MFCPLPFCPMPLLHKLYLESYADLQKPNGLVGQRACVVPTPDKAGLPNVHHGCDVQSDLLTLR